MSLKAKRISITKSQCDEFNNNGFIIINNLLNSTEIEEYRSLYDRFLNGEIECKEMRSDLGKKDGQDITEIENVTQIMWPSVSVPELFKKPLHQRSLEISRQLLGEDAIFDFDMLIYKAPNGNTSTPWHQDAAYWPHMPDERAVSAWVALDQSTQDNGCMYFIPGSHRNGYRQHQFAETDGGSLECYVSENEAVFVELEPGSATFHHGLTAHHTPGNITSSHRRAFITNFRPAAMVKLEREMGFAHGLSGSVEDRKIRNDRFK